MTGPIPDAAVEIAARTAYHADWRGPDEPSWDELPAGDADSYRTYVRRILAAAAPLLAAAALAKAGAALLAADLDDWPGGRYGDVSGCRDRAVAIVERLLAIELERATPDGGSDG